jgi:peptidoglycan-N-acetylmuramic acid deacetylase
MTYAMTLVYAFLLTLHWGLGFPEPGKPPVTDVPAEHIRQFDAVHMGDPEGKTIYLTFDAGYDPAAFFIVGHYVESAPELVKRMKAEGHIIGNHTKRHPDMSKITDPAVFKKELDSLDEMLKGVIGEGAAKYYRPPAGTYTDGNLKTAQKLGYKTVFWSLAYADWHQDRQPSHEHAMAKLTKRVHPGAIILLHSTSKTNAEILGGLIDRYREMGYTFGTLDELFAKNVGADIVSAPT